MKSLLKYSSSRPRNQVIPRTDLTFLFNHTKSMFKRNNSLITILNTKRRRWRCCIAHILEVLISSSHYTKWLGLWPRLSPVVWRSTSANPGLNFNLGFIISLFKNHLGKIFPILFITSNDQIARKKIWKEFLFKLSDLKSNFTLTPGYLNPALNKPGLDGMLFNTKIIRVTSANQSISYVLSVASKLLFLV